MKNDRERREDILDPFIHLQWFAEEDIGEDTGEEDIEETPGAFTEVDPDKDYEIVFEGEEEDSPGESREELIARLRAQEAALAAAQKPDASEVLAREMQGIKEVLTPKPPPIDYVKLAEEERSRFNSNFLDDPYKNMSELVIKKVLPEIKKNMQNSGTIKLAKKITLQDENNKKIYDKYSQEVEGNVQRIITTSPNRYSDPDVYTDALREAKANHMDELIDELVQEKVSAALKTNGKKFTLNTGNSPAPAKPGTRKKLRITPAQRAEAQELADRSGISLNKVLATKYGD